MSFSRPSIHTKTSKTWLIRYTGEELDPNVKLLPKCDFYGFFDFNKGVDRHDYIQKAELCYTFKTDDKSFPVRICTVDGWWSGLSEKKAQELFKYESNAPVSNHQEREILKKLRDVSNINLSVF